MKQTKTAEPTTVIAVFTETLGKGAQMPRVKTLADRLNYGVPKIRLAIVREGDGRKKELPYLPPRMLPGS